MSLPPDQADALAGSAEWLCQDIDVARNQSLFVRVSPQEYRQSIFLDQRLAVARPQQRVVPLWPLVKDMAGRSLQPVRWIFHIGHCGSTYVSRLLEAVQPGLLALREPLPLLTLAVHKRQLDDPLGLLDPALYPQLEHAVAQLVGRRFNPSEATVVKATSDCALVAERLLGLHAGNRALVLTLSLERYLQVMLRSEERRSESRGHGWARLADLHCQLNDRSIRLYQLTSGELAAMNWLSLQLTLQAASASSQARLIDFDAFLKAPQTALAKVCQWFGLSPSEPQLSAVLSSAAATSYSKDPGLQFDAAARAEQLKTSAANNADQISAGLRWAEKTIAANSLGGLRLTGG